MLYIIYSGFEVYIFLIFKFSIVLIVSDFPLLFCLLFYCCVAFVLLYCTCTKFVNVQKTFSCKIWSRSINSMLPWLFSNNGCGMLIFQLFLWYYLEKERERREGRRTEMLPTYIIIFWSSPDVLFGKSENFVSSFQKV